MHVYLEQQLLDGRQSLALWKQALVRRVTAWLEDNQQSNPVLAVGRTFPMLMEMVTAGVGAGAGAGVVS
jgi:hypothetical protein